MGMYIYNSIDVYRYYLSIYLSIDLSIYLSRWVNDRFVVDFEHENGSCQTTVPMHELVCGSRIRFAIG